MCCIGAAKPEKDNGLKEAEYLKDNGMVRKEKEKKVAVTGSGASGRLASLSMEELRYHAVGRALLTKEESLVTPCDELEELLESFAYGITYEPTSMPLHPYTEPPFTISDVAALVPRHLFKRNLLIALYYILLDIFLIAATFYAGTFIGQSKLPLVVKCVLWTFYWHVQGMNFFAVWIMCHDLGHNVASEWELLDDVLQWLLSSFVLFPSYSWKINHSQHHAHIASVENDEAYPYDKTEASLSEPPEWTLRRKVLQMFWYFPGAYYFYLFTGGNGPLKHPQTLETSVYNPWSSLFEQPRDIMGVILSDIGVLIMLIGLLVACCRFGVATVFTYYYVPYLICNGGVVMMSFMQHADVGMPAFRESNWSWFKAALCSVDRSMGAIIDHQMHHANDTHVAHHLFSRIPHYNMQEVTIHVARALGEYYSCDTTPMAQCILRTWLTAIYCDNNKDQTVLYKRSDIKP